MKLTKEQIYINLQGKTKEELTDLWEFLNSAGEKQYLNLSRLINEIKGWDYFIFGRYEQWTLCVSKGNKQEVTIEQLKKIIKPMGTFTPIAMKCTQEQFNAIKPKLENCKIQCITNFIEMPYLINNRSEKKNNITNYMKLDAGDGNRRVHEEWNEQLFLKACGVEVETLQEKAIRLENELKEVKQNIEEENKPKLNDWVYNKEEELFYKKSYNIFNQYENKITDQELINKLNELIK